MCEKRGKKRLKKVMVAFGKKRPLLRGNGGEGTRVLVRGKRKDWELQEKSNRGVDTEEKEGTRSKGKRDLHVVHEEDGGDKR